MNALAPTPSELRDLAAFRDEVGNPLRKEMTAARLAIEFAQVGVLRGLGLPPAQLLADDMIGVVRASVDKRDFWTPDEGGKRLLVTPLIEDGATTDIIAFDPKEPNAWFLRTGNGWALGADAVRRASDPWPTDHPIIIHATPMQWLQSGCDGACVTQWTHEARVAVRNLPACDVPSPEFARALRLELTRPPRIPEISVRSWQNRAA